MNPLFTGAISGFLAVALGAFGAHALKASLSEYAMTIFSTANEYHFYHSLALVLVGLLIRQKPSPSLLWSGRCFASGTLLFSGSLYALSLTGVSWLGAITPMGGVLFLVGWIMLAIEAIKH